MKTSSASMIILFTVSLTLILAACGDSGGEVAQPTATSTPSPTVAQPFRTPEPTPTGAPAETGTSTATPETRSPMDSSLPTPPGLSPSPTPTRVPALTETPSVEPTLPATVVITPTATTVEPTTLEGIETAQEVVNSFPNEVVFSLSARSEATIEEVTLHYQILPDGVMAYGRPDFTPAERVQVNFYLKGNDPPRSYLAPGAQIDYFWEVEDAAGNKLTTEPATFIYEDIRFPWESVSEGNVTIYWYAGSRSSAESSLEVARDTLDKMSALLGVTVDYPVKVWIYDSYEDMLPALVRRSEAHAQRVVVAGMRVSSDTILLQGEGAGDTLRHELAHVVTHVAGEGPYGSLPTWLDEGTAMYAQSEPGEGYTSALEKAVKSDSLFSVRSMTAPTGDPSKVGLFYGQAWSLVNFLIETYGPAKFAELFATIKEGTALDEALFKVYGFDQDGLDDAWRASLGLAPASEQ